MGGKWKLVLPALVVGVLCGAAGWLTNGLAGVTVGGAYSHVDSGARIPIDTGLSGGRSPQTLSAEVFRIAAASVAIDQNTASATAGAATLSRLSGLVTTEALSTAPGATYTLTLTNTLVTTGSTVLVEVHAGTDTAVRGSQMQVTSVTPGAGSVVIVLTNQGSVALNGTLLVPFALF